MYCIVPPHSKETGWPGGYEPACGEDSSADVELRGHGGVQGVGERPARSVGEAKVDKEEYTLSEAEARMRESEGKPREERTKEFTCIQTLAEDRLGQPGTNEAWLSGVVLRGAMQPLAPHRPREHPCPGEHPSSGGHGGRAGLEQRRVGVGEHLEEQLWEVGRGVDMGHVTWSLSCTWRRKQNKSEGRGPIQTPWGPAVRARPGLTEREPGVLSGRRTGGGRSRVQGRVRRGRGARGLGSSTAGTAMGTG